MNLYYVKDSNDVFHCVGATRMNITDNGMLLAELEETEGFEMKVSCPAAWAPGSWKSFTKRADDGVDTLTAVIDGKVMSFSA